MMHITCAATFFIAEYIILQTLGILFVPTLSIALDDHTGKNLILHVVMPRKLLTA